MNKAKYTVDTDFGTTESERVVLIDIANGREAAKALISYPTQRGQ